MLKRLVMCGRIKDVIIVGGRNVEEKYFDLDPEFCYLDRDALVIGPVVAEVADSFDSYWVDPVVVRAEYLTAIGNNLLAWAEERGEGRAYRDCPFRSRFRRFVHRGRGEPSESAADHHSVP